MIVTPLAKGVGTGTGAALTGMTPVTGGMEGSGRLALVVSIKTVGATPALSVALETSEDGTNWTALKLLVPDTATAAATPFAFPTPAADKKAVCFVDGLDKRFFKMFRVNATANTNVTNWDAELQRVDQ